MSRCESHGWPLLFSSPDDRTGENRVPDGRWYAIRALNQAYMLIYRAMHSVTLGAAIACNDVSGPCLRAFLVKRAVMESSEDCWRSYGIGCPDHRAWLGQCPSIPQYAWTQHPGHCLLLISIIKHAAGVLTTTARQICQICGRSAQIAQIRQPVWSIKPPISSLLLTRGRSHFQNKARKCIRTLSVPAYAERIIASPTGSGTSIHPTSCCGQAVLELYGMQMANCLAAIL